MKPHQIDITNTPDTHSAQSTIVQAGRVGEGRVREGIVQAGRVQEGMEEATTYLAKGLSGTVFIVPDDRTTVGKVFRNIHSYNREVRMLERLHTQGVSNAVIMKGHDDIEKTVLLEYLPHTLEDLIVQRTLAPEQKKEILEQLAWFLVQMKVSGVVHGDFKAKNVVVSADKRVVKVVDYERSKLSDDNNDDIKKFKFIMVQMAFDLPYAKSYKRFAKYAERFERAELLTLTDILQIYDILSGA